MARSDAILARLLRLHPKIIDLSLERMWRILERLGNPQQRLAPVIHVAGTNGKGSSIAFMNAILARAGLTANVYTSPHLVRFHERIRLGAPDGGELIGEDHLARLLEECEQANGGEPITYFEITTAAALLAFARHKADYVLLEVGLGGRLDATNVIARPAVSAITPLGIDHQHYLGQTMAEIAAEKAGILKPGVAAVIGPQADEALAVITEQAGRVGAPLAVANQDWQAYEQHGRLVYQDQQGLLDLDLPNLPGRFQIDNAGLAVACLRQLGDQRIGERAIRQGLRSACWPGRLQRLEAGKLVDLAGSAEVWLDGGHNGDAGRALAQALADIGERAGGNLALVVGMLESKHAHAFLEAFQGLAGHVVTLTIPGEDAAIPGSELARMADQMGFPARSAATIEQAMEIAGLAAGRGGRVVVCGSLYLAGHVLALNAGDQASGPSGSPRR